MTLILATVARLCGLIPGWLYAAILAVLLALYGTTVWQRNSARDDLRVYRAQVAEAREKAEAESRAKERILQDKADQQLKAKDDAIAIINARHAAAIRSLRNRAARSAADVPKAASAGADQPGCTGAQLYRDDSELLVRLARDADELRVGLKACYDQYNAARETLNAR